MAQTRINLEDDNKQLRDKVYNLSAKVGDLGSLGNGGQYLALEGGGGGDAKELPAIVAAPVVENALAAEAASKGPVPVEASSTPAGGPSGPVVNADSFMAALLDQQEDLGQGHLGE